MKAISEKTTAIGKRRVTVELEAGETLIAVRDDSHYRLGQPVDEVIAGHVLADTVAVTWCSASQEWAS